METSDLIATRLGSLDDLRAEWGALALAVGNVFGSPEFLSLWWEHFGAGRELLAYALWAPGGELIAIVPLYRWLGPLGVVRFLGHEVGDELGPVCLPEHRAGVAGLLVTLAAESRWNVVLGEHLPGDAGWGALLGGRVLARDGSPVLRLDGDWDAVLGRWGSSSRKDVRRKERALASKHHIELRAVDRVEELAPALDRLFALHRAHWADARSAFTPYESFHRDFARAAFESGWLRLSFLEVDGEQIAAWYGFRYGGVQSHFQSGRVPRWEDESLGLVHTVQEIRAAIDAGLSEYRFLRGRQPYKYRFSDFDPEVETIAVGCGARGRTLLRLEPLARRARALRRFA